MRLKAQSATEFMTQYGIAIGIAVAAVVTVFLISVPLRQSTYSPSYCYITPELNCYQMLVVSNTITGNTDISIAFTNNLGKSIYLPTDPAFYIAPTATSSYTGGWCSDPNTGQRIGVLRDGGSAMCSATVSESDIKPGAQLEPKFYLTYNICSKSDCSDITPSSFKYTTSGSAVAYATPVASTTTSSTSTSTSTIS